MYLQKSKKLLSKKIIYDFIPNETMINIGS